MPSESCPGRPKLLAAETGHALVAVVDLSLQWPSDATRSLSLDLNSQPPRYRYGLTIAGTTRELGGPMRLHGFIPVLFAALLALTLAASAAVTAPRVNPRKGFVALCPFPIQPELGLVGGRPFHHESKNARAQTAFQEVQGLVERGFCDQ